MSLCSALCSGDRDATVVPFLSLKLSFKKKGPPYQTDFITVNKPIGQAPTEPGSEEFTSSSMS